MTHANGPFELEGPQRLVKHCRSRPIAHMAAEAGICRACLSKWKNRYDTYGETGLQNRSSVPPSSPTPTPPEIVERIELLRRGQQVVRPQDRARTRRPGRVDQRTHGEPVAGPPGHRPRWFLDPDGSVNRRPPKRFVARYPGHTVHLDVKKVGRIPDGGGWRTHGRDSEQARAAQRAKTAGAKGGYVSLHSAVAGFSRPAYTEPLADEKATTAAAFLSRTRAFFTAHRSDHGPHHSAAQTIAQPGTPHLRSRTPPQPPAAQRPPTSYGSGEQFTGGLKTVGGWGPSPAGAGSGADP